MATKDQMLKVIQELPENADVEEAIERLYLLAKVERAMAQADAGQTTPHEDAMRRLSQWLE